MPETTPARPRPPPTGSRMDAYLECATTGVSGDKFLAATLDAGADLPSVRASLDALGLGIILKVEKATRGGIRGTLATVEASGEMPRRTWGDIRELLEGTALPGATRSLALRAFERLAQAEAEVLGVAPEEVHFHEVGAADAIGEIVGVAAALSSLGIERLHVSRVAVGSGTVECEHGTLPVPAPATALLLKDVPICEGAGPGELTTPTGAAITVAAAAGYGAMPPMTATSVGHGAGTREAAAPNIARLFVGRFGPGREVGAGPGPTHDMTAGLRTEEVTLLSTTIDHISGELAAFAMERIADAGALDCWMTPTLMKKGRPGLLLEAVAGPDTAGAIAAAIIRETGTLGVRISSKERFTVPRSSVTVETQWGPVRVKVAELPDGRRFRAELDDCSLIAREHHLEIAEVAEVAERLARG